MAMVKVGDKMVGWWGAMFPYGYGRVASVDGNSCVIEFEDCGEKEVKIVEIYWDLPESCGVGVYRAPDDFPEDWFPAAA